MDMKIKNKEDIVSFVKHQTNVELANDPNEPFNKRKNILYTEVGRRNKYTVLPLFHKYGIRYVEHLNDKYWVYVK